MLDTAYQGYEFLAAMYTGLLMGLLYSLFSLLRGLLGHKKLSNAILDALFWVIAGAGVFVAALYINGARFRWHLFLGLGLGLALHFYSVGIIIKKSSVWIRTKCRRKAESEGPWPGKRRKKRKSALG